RLLRLPGGRRPRGRLRHPSARPGPGRGRRAGHAQGRMTPTVTGARRRGNGWAGTCGRDGGSDGPEVGRLAAGRRGVAVLVAAGLAAGLVLGACSSAGGGGPGGAPGAGPPPRPPTPPPPTTAAPTTEPPTTEAPSTTVAPTTTTKPKPAAPAKLPSGSKGAAVKALQQRLHELGYQVQEADGQFGPETHHSVGAFQKVNRLGRDGVVGPITRKALANPRAPKPRSAKAGFHVEADLTLQAASMARAGKGGE